MNNLIRNAKNFSFIILGKRGYDFLRLLNRIRKILFKVRDFNDGIISFHSKLIKEDSIILDIGSNRGYFTYRYSKIANKGFIYSFEPIPSTFKLQKNLLKYFRIDNCKVFNLALSDKVGTIEMILPKIGYFPNDLCATIKTDNSAKSFANFEVIQTSCDTLDNIITKENIVRLDFIKMDVEGAEYLVLKGAVKTLCFRPIIFMEMIEKHFHKFGYKKEDIITFMQSNNYEPMFYDEEMCYLIPYVGERVECLDVYFIPAEKISLIKIMNLILN